MEETPEQRRRRLYGSVWREKYLGILNKLVNYEVTREDLLSIVETDECVVPFDKVLYYKTEILFSEKERLRDIIKAKVMNINASYFILTYNYERCGALKIPSIQNFNFDFQFDDDPAGIFSFVECNLQEDIILDFYEEHDEEFLEIEFYRRKT